MEIKACDEARFMVTFDGVDETSKSYRLKGQYTLLLTDKTMALCDQSSADVFRVVYEWSYVCIRDYGANRDYFYIRTGRMHKNGEPVFAIPTTESESIMKIVDEIIENRLREKTESGLSYQVSFNQDDDSSKRCMLKGTYKLEVTNHSLRLFPESADHLLFEWEFAHIKQFAQTDTYFVMEVDRGGSTQGWGIFYMHTKKGLSLCAVLQTWKDIQAQGKTVMAGDISFA